MDYSKAKDLLRLQQEVGKIKKELSNTHIEAEAGGVVITVDCELKVVSVSIEDTGLLSQQKNLESAILEATNKGMKKAQESAAQKMQSVASDMGINLPGGHTGM